MAKMTGQAAADLNTSVMTVSSRYRHENQNSIYYLRPNSNDIFFLDFKLKGFVTMKKGSPLYNKAKALYRK